MIPRFVHCAGDVIEQGARIEVVALADARVRVDHWRLAAAAHLALDQPRLSGVYARAAKDLGHAVSAAERWRRCGRATSHGRTDG